MKRKTITINRKRYTKTKPSDLYLVKLIRYDFTRDQYGDAIDEESTLELANRLMSLREVIQAIKDHGCTMDSTCNGDSMFFDSEYSNSEYIDEDHYTESQWTLNAQSTKSRTNRLDRIVNRSKYERRKQRDIERLEREREELEATTRRLSFKVIDGATSGNGLPSRKSRAQLSLVS